jgi:hypothetical protein
MVFERERKRLMARRSSLRPGKQPSTEVTDYIERYNPKWSPTNRQIWRDDLADTVKGWVTFVCPGTREVARALLRYSSEYCLWHFKKNRNLEAKDLWTPRAIEHWCQVQMCGYSQVWKTTAEDRLKSMGPFLNPKGPWPKPPKQQPRRPRLAGYTHQEEQAYIDAALAYTRAPRPRVLFFVAAAMGAGLDGYELLQVTAADVIITRSHVSIRVTDEQGFQRDIPVRRPYHDMLKEAVATSTTPLLIGDVGGRRNIISQLSQRVVVDGLPRLKTFRMRSTWLERHIANGTDISLLIELAGRPSAESVIQAALRVGVSNRAAALAQARRA